MKKYTALIVTLAVIFILVLTNPKKTDYYLWLNEKSVYNTASISETDTRNFVIFSTYKTTYSDGEWIFTVGVLNNFISGS